MEYFEAANIAKQNPGSVVTRDDSGSFIVCLAHGAVIGPSQYASDVLQASLRHREKQLDDLSRICDDYASREIQLKHEIAALTETITTYRGFISQAKLEINQLSLEVESLQSKLAKVSTVEWERIKESDRLNREADLARRKAERTADFARRKAECTTVKCSCGGAVENCNRCFGAGEYTVDGLGNPV